VRPATLRKILLPLTLTLASLPAAGQDAEIDRRIASAQGWDVVEMAAFPEVLVVRQGAAVYGLDPYSLQQLWVFQGTELVNGPILLGERLFVIDREIRESSSGYGTSRTTYHNVIELDPATGRLRWQKESASSSARVLSACERVVFLLDKFILSVSGEARPVRVALVKHLGPDLARAVSPERIWLAGDHLVAWVPDLRLAATLPLDERARPWRRPFSEGVMDVAGCGDVQVVTTAGDTLLGVDARTAKTIWQLTRPWEDRPILRFQPGDFVPMPAKQRLEAYRFVPLGIGSDAPKWRLELVEAEDVPAHRLTWIDPKDGSILPFPLEDALTDARGFLQDGHERAVLFMGSRLTVHSFASGAREWTYDAGEPIRLTAPAESYVALVTESGRLDVLGQSRPRSPEEQPLPDAGGIDLSTDPEDAAVWLDASFLGRGGRRIGDLSPGTHRLRLVHPDRKRLETVAEVAPGRITPLVLTMESGDQGTVLIDSDPAGAIVSIDGEKAGKTPFTDYKYPAGQSLQVTVERMGYWDVRQILSVGEEGATLSASLELAPPLLSVFGIVGRAGTGPIRGWRETDIREGQVAGRPYRPADGDTFLKGTYSLEIGPPRWRFFGRGNFSSHEDIFSEFQGGVWLSLKKGLRVEAGISYLAMEGGLESSPPSRRGEGFEGTPDRDAPLEEWEHPVPGVFVRNDAPRYWLGQIRLRPRAGLLVELGAGRPQNARLNGTALVEDASGHLVRDPARFYDFRARGGEILDARLHLALGTFRIWKLAPSTAVEIHYRFRRTDFGAVEEKTSELTLGFGVLLFRSQPLDVWGLR